MEYEVLLPISYNGKIYDVGEVVKILEVEVAKKCIDRKLIKLIEKKETSKKEAEEKETVTTNEVKGKKGKKK